MIMNQFGQTYMHDHTCLYIGQGVVANDNSVYAGLCGVITAIRDGEDKDTENAGVDVCCDFTLPKSDSIKAQLEKRFTLFAEDIPLEDVVMAPEMIEPKAEFQINPSQPFYVLTYTIETDENFDTFVLDISGSIDALKRKMQTHIKANPHFANTDIVASDDYCVCEYDVHSVPDDGKRHVLTADKDDEYYKYVISEVQYVPHDNEEKGV